MQALPMLTLIGLFCGVQASAQSAPIVANVQAHQVPGTDQVRVTYDLEDGDSDLVTVTLRVSDNGGTTFEVPAFRCRGDVFKRVYPGPGKALWWDAHGEYPGRAGDNWQVEVVARDGTVVDLLPSGIPVEFVVIQPGTFTMGSTTGYSDELPPHQVTLTSPYCLGVYEITQAQWRSVMTNPPWTGKDLAKDGPFYPAAYISWDDLQVFLARLNGTEPPSGGSDGGTPAEPDVRADLVESLPGGASIHFIWIELGSYSMGSPASEAGRLADEGPQHEVTISQGFYLAQYEVTQVQWEGVMHTRPWAGQDYVVEEPSRPAVFLEWQDAQAFVHALNRAAGDSLYRLPTEAEWEYAARAGTTTAWSFGDDETGLGEYAWYRSNAWEAGLQQAQVVGTRRPNPWGLYDMHGNAWEWVQDRYGTYPSDAQADPLGPPSGPYWVLRGGGFSDYAATTRAASRLAGTPHPRRYVMGTRLLRRGPRQETPLAPKRAGCCGTETTPETGAAEAAPAGRYRLATEAEWEYAARAGTGTRWSFGDDVNLLGDYAWYRANCADQGAHYGHLVGTRLPNPWGLYDVHGNLWESVRDLYGPYLSEPQVDPQGPLTGAFNSRRGGGFANDRTEDLTSAVRGKSAPYNCGWCMGGRLARDYNAAADGKILALATPANGTREGRGRSALFSLDLSLPTAIAEAGASTVPLPLALLPAAPNPCNSSTAIRYSLPSTAEVSLVIYDLLGQPVSSLVAGPRTAGAHSVPWDARDAGGQAVASGVYLCRLTVGDQVRVQRLLLLR